MSVNYLPSFPTTDGLHFHYNANEKFIIARDLDTRQPKCWSRRSLQPLDMDKVYSIRVITLHVIFNNKYFFAKFAVGEVQPQIQLHLRNEFPAVRKSLGVRAHWKGPGQRQ